jgi:hypothetical protein
LPGAGCGQGQQPCRRRGQPVAGGISAAAPQGGDAQVQRTVIEDDGVRIEETRHRGAARRIVVHSKVGGVREYEIQVAPAGRDPAQDRGGAGQRAWSLFNF